MADQLTDCKITKVYEGPSDVSEHGPWTLWNFYTDKGDKQKFTWFGGDKKITPVEGMQIAYMEYEEETKGKYTNLNVKKLVLKENSTPEAIPNAKEDMGSIPSDSKPDKEVSYWVRYMTDLSIAIIAAGGNLETADLDSMARRIGKAGLIMMNESLNSVPIPSQDNKKAPPVQDNEKSVPSDTQEDYSGKIVCPNLTDNDGNPKEILKRACKTCSQQQGCPAL